MKRSEINRACRQAADCFQRHSWAQPPKARWDITDFGLGDFARCGLVLVNHADEEEYCEKLMYARKDQCTPCHTHARKKEDIICRVGSLTVWLWARQPTGEDEAPSESVRVSINGAPIAIPAGRPFKLEAGHGLTLTPGSWDAFAPSSPECIIGEVSTANDDAHDNFFLDTHIGHFPGIEEDEVALIRLLSE